MGAYFGLILAGAGLGQDRTELLMPNLMLLGVFHDR